MPAGLSLATIMKYDIFVYSELNGGSDEVWEWLRALPAPRSYKCSEVKRIGTNSAPTPRDKQRIILPCELLAGSWRLNCPINVPHLIRRF